MTRFGTPALLARAALAALLASFVVDAVPASASPNVEVALLAEQTSVQPGRPFHLGLRMKIRKGWHTYWKNPGDAGMPLRVAWDLPEGFSAGPIEWPAPERMPEGDLMSYGYRGEVLLPVEIVPPESFTGDSVSLAGTFEWLECADVCAAGSSALRLSLPVRPSAPTPGPAARAFAEARSRIPTAPEGWTFAATAGPRAVSLEWRPPPGVDPRAAYFFADAPLVADYAAPQGFERTDGGFRITAAPAPNAQEAPERLTGVLVLEGPPKSTHSSAVLVDVPLAAGDPAPAPAQPSGSGSPTSLLPALLALVGVVVAVQLLRRSPLGRKEVQPPPEPDA